MNSDDESTVAVTFRLNGVDGTHRVQPRTHLVDFLRDSQGLVGTRAGCEHGVCGACTVRIDGAIARGCLVLPAQLEGADVWTIEGLDGTGELKELQEAFHQCNAVQCGFCTSGMLVTASQLVVESSGDTPPDRAQIREYMSGNLCRCTGYQSIIDAVKLALRAKGNTSHD